MRNNVENEFKILVAGDTDVEKVTLINQLVGENTTIEDPKELLSTDFKTKRVKLNNGCSYKAVLWDTSANLWYPSEQRYIRNQQNTLRRTNAMILVFDANDSQSLERMQAIYAHLPDNVKSSLTFFVMADTHAIAEEDKENETSSNGSDWACEKGFKFNTFSSHPFTDLSYQLEELTISVFHTLQKEFIKVWEVMKVLSQPSETSLSLLNADLYVKIAALSSVNKSITAELESKLQRKMLVTDNSQSVQDTRRRCSVM